MSNLERLRHSADHWIRDHRGIPLSVSSDRAGRFITRRPRRRFRFIRGLDRALINTFSNLCDRRCYGQFCGRFLNALFSREMWRRGFAGIFFGGLGFIAASLVLVSLFAFLPVPYTPLVGIRAVEAGFSEHTFRAEKAWIPIDAMAPSILRAAIASEDFRFTEHRGFDFDAIHKAMRANERSEKHGLGKVLGASTISQQTAKNVFLWPGRTWVRKGLEAWLTVLIETAWSKRRILEVYLNVIEFGDGIYGVEAASQRFFHKPAIKLNASEAALLIAVLPNPRKFHVESPSAYVRFRQTSILRRLSYVEVPE